MLEFSLLICLPEKLANTEQHLSVAKGHSSRAEDKTDELKQLNRSIFRPVITFNKDAKRAAQERKALERFEDERTEREKAMMDIRETQNRLGRATTYGRDDEDEDEGIKQQKTTQRLADRKEQRKRYQFEATASDDEIEDELDDNLHGISQATKSLKALGMAMGQELDQQNNRLRRIEDQTVALDSRIYRNTERVCVLHSYGPITSEFLRFSAEKDQVRFLVQRRRILVPSGSGLELETIYALMYYLGFPLNESK